MIRLLAGIAGLLATTLLGGCAGDAQLRAQIAGANIEIARGQAAANARPLVSIQCPPAGCVFAGLEVAQTGQAAPHVAMPDNPWARVADRAMGVLGAAAGIYLGGEAAANIAGQVAGGITSSLTASHAGANAAVQTVGAAGVAGQSIQAGAISDALGAMPGPLVVTQPPPLVVTQPPPVIVPPAEPVIVHPVVVDPIVVEVGQ
jgi:hypothetical protein